MNKRYICMISVFLLFFSSCSIIKEDYRNHKEDGITELSVDDHRYPKLNKNDEADSNLESYSLAEKEMVWDNVALYFHDSKGEKLVPEMRKIPKSTEKDFLENIMQALIKGPVDKSLKPVISRNTKINKIEQIDSILTIDLSYEFLQSTDLLAARTSIANTITSLEPFKYVNILVENHKLTKDGKPTGSVVGLISRNSNNYSRIEEEEIKRLNNSGINTVFMDLYFQDYENLYLVPEVRNVVYNKKDELPRAIVEELIKGPQDLNGGKKPTIPKGTVLKDIRLIKDSSTEKVTAVLYFSREFKSNFRGSMTRESLMLGSLIMSLSGVSDISYIKVFYENGNDEYIDMPIVSFPLNERLESSVFKQYIGRTVKIYYGNANGKGLSSEYRTVKRDDKNIPLSIINKLITSPKHTDSIKLMPDNIGENEITVDVEGKTAFVNLPDKFFDADEKKTNYILLLYSIVNSLTDPINSSTIEEVQFLVDNKIVDNVKGISLLEPFIRKPEIS